MSHSHKLILLCFLTSITSSGACLAAVPAQTIAENLDITSFKNSLGPRSLTKGTTLPMLGFTKAAYDEQSKVYELTDVKNTWTYSVKVIAEHKTNADICFYDFASRPNASYRSIQKLAIKESSNGKYIATKQYQNNIACEN